MTTRTHIDDGNNDNRSRLAAGRHMTTDKAACGMRHHPCCMLRSQPRVICVSGEGPHVRLAKAPCCEGSRTLWGRCLQAPRARCCCCVRCAAPACSSGELRKACAAHACREACTVHSARLRRAMFCLSIAGQLGVLAFTQVTLALSFRSTVHGWRSCLPRPPPSNLPARPICLPHSLACPTCMPAPPTQPPTHRICSFSSRCRSGVLLCSPAAVAMSGNCSQEGPYMQGRQGLEQAGSLSRVLNVHGGHSVLNAMYCQARSCALPAEPQATTLFFFNGHMPRTLCSNLLNSSSPAPLQPQAWFPPGPLLQPHHVLHRALARREVWLLCARNLLILGSSILWSAGNAPASAKRRRGRGHAGARRQGGGRLGVEPKATQGLGPGRLPGPRWAKPWARHCRVRSSVGKMPAMYR